MAEAAGPAVDPDPDPALLVFEDIYVVIAAAHRPELRPGHSRSEVNLQVALLAPCVICQASSLLSS